MSNNTKKFKNTAIAITTGMLAASITACTFGKKTVPVESTAPTPSAEAAVTNVSPEDPITSEKKDSGNTKSETKLETTVSDEKSSVPLTKKTTSVTPGISLTVQSKIADTPEETAVYSTASDSIVSTGSSTARSGSDNASSTSSDPVVDELAALRSSVEKAAKALASAIATRDSAVTANENAKEALS